MTFCVSSLNFSTLELERLTYERLSFKTQLKIAFLWPNTGHKKVFGNIPGMAFNSNLNFSRKCVVKLINHFNNTKILSLRRH